MAEDHQQASAVKPPNSKYSNMMSRGALCMVIVGFLTLPIDSLGGNFSYTCRDSDGKRSMGDGPPGNECKSDICVFKDGIKTCAGNPPPEVPDAPGDSQAEKNHEQWLSDIAFLERYPTVEQIEVDRRRDLKSFRASIEDVEAKYAGALRKKERLDQELEFYPRGAPPDLADQVKSTKELLEQLGRQLQHGNVEEEHINAKYDNYVKRWQELSKKLHGKHQP